MNLPPKESAPEGAIMWLITGPLIMALVFFMNSEEYVLAFLVMCLMAVMVIFREYAKDWRREKNGKDE